MDGIDLNRGCFQRFHPEGAYLISMYRDEPGLYYDEHGNPVKETVAEECGFPVKEYRIERRKRELKAEKIAEIDAAFAKAEEEAQQEAERAEEVAEAQAAAEAEPETPSSGRKGKGSGGA